MTSPSCPRCHAEVGATWRWCLACGYDPEWLKPQGWTPGQAPPARTLVGAGVGGAPMAAQAAAAPSPHPYAPSSLPHAGPTPGATPGQLPGQPVARVDDARPQTMTDPDWAPVEPRRRMSYLGVAGLIAAIVIAIGTLVLVTILVLNRPIGTTQANAAAIAPVAVSGPVAAAGG